MLANRPQVRLKITEWVVGNTEVIQILKGESFQTLQRALLNFLSPFSEDETARMAARGTRKLTASLAAYGNAMRSPLSIIVVGGPKGLPLLSKNCSGPSPR